jgi:pyridoxal phosphate enzyme (YggS family)
VTTDLVPHIGLSAVQSRVESAAAAARRPADDVTLIAVSKTFGPSEILPVIAAGQCHFGENRVQEAKSKWPQLKARFPHLNLHLIGPLQSNKAAEAVGLFDVIHTLDRPKIAAAIAGEIAKTGRKPMLFIQVNTGNEPQKAGIAPNDAERFLAVCRDRDALTISGLMCIPPANEDPSSHFRLLAGIARDLGLRHLSMGMSGDFEIAIGCGATFVRVGSAIFGARTGSPQATGK